MRRWLGPVQLQAVPPGTMRHASGTRVARTSGQLLLLLGLCCAGATAAPWQPPPPPPAEICFALPTTHDGTVGATVAVVDEARLPPNTKRHSSTYLAMGLADVRAGTQKRRGVFGYPPEH